MVTIVPPVLLPDDGVTEVIVGPVVRGAAEGSPVDSSRCRWEEA